MDYRIWNMKLTYVELEKSPLFSLLQHVPTQIYWRFTKQEQRWKSITVHGYDTSIMREDALSLIEYQILFRSLSALESRVLTLTVIEEFTERETAELLDYSKSRIHTIKLSALRKLRRQLHG